MGKNAPPDEILTYMSPIRGLKIIMLAYLGIIRSMFFRGCIFIDLGFRSTRNDTQSTPEITVVAAKIGSDSYEMMPKSMFGLPSRRIQEPGRQKNAHPGNPECSIGHFLAKSSAQGLLLQLWENRKSVQNRTFG